MNVDKLVRDALQEQAADQGHVAGDLADRVLAAGRRRRTRTLVGTALATAAAVAVAVAVPTLGSGDGAAEGRPASGPSDRDVIAHPDQSPPRDLIAAGNTAVAGFSVRKTVKHANGDELHTRTYSLLDPTTGRYRKAPGKWKWIDVAPGLRTAAVLEGELPVRRVGLLDLRTGEVERWIPTPQPVAGVEWSPDGNKLVATAYGADPDRLVDLPGDHPKNGPQPRPSRLGFMVIDVASGDVEKPHSVPQPEPDKWGFYGGDGREDFRWSRDGTRLYLQQVADEGSENRAWYTLRGKRTTAPAKERYASYPQDGLSPDGRYLAADGSDKGLPLLDPLTGKKIATVPGKQHLAWVGDKRLIAWGCEPAKCSGRNEFRAQLILVTVGSKKIVPLSGFRGASADRPGGWSPMFAAR